MYLKVYKVKLLMLMLFLPFILLAQSPPAGWEYTTTPNSHTIAVPVSANPTFNGAALPAGSWIGAFFMDGAVEKCGGAAQWTGTGNIAVVAFGDDETTTPAVKEGFDEGELIKWKVYIASLNASFAATVSYDATLPNFDGNFHAFGMSALTSLASTGYVTQCIPLTGVKFASSYIQDLDPNFRNICTEILPTLNQAKNSTGSTLRKVGVNWVNGIGNWVVTEGYWFKMNAAGTLCLTGNKVNPQTPIALSGVKFVAYLHDFQMSALTAFATILPNLNQAKNSTGQTLRKVGVNWVNGIGNLKPGEGYWVKMNTAGTLIYPAADNSAQSAVFNTKVNSQKSDPVHFPIICGDPAENTWSIYVRSAILSGITMEPGDEIAVYDGDKCVGSKVFDVVPSPDTQFETELVGWTAFCEGDGWVDGNPVTFKIWDASTNKESIICDVVYNNEYGDAWSTGVFPNQCCQYSMVDLTCIGQGCTTPPTAFAGDDAAVCAGNNYTLAGATASNYTTLAWSSNGTGTFNFSNILNPVYIPGTGDVTVTLTLTASADGCPDAVDFMVLTVNPLPTPPTCPPDLTNICVNAAAFEYGGYTIDPATLGTGTHEFVITNTNNCGSESCYFYVTIIDLPVAPVCPPDLTSICVNAEPFEYGGYMINPAELGVGTHDFTITNSNQCGSLSCTFYVTIIGLPEVPVCPPDMTDVCVNADPFEYGGYYIDPSLLGVGVHSYTITNTNQCGSASCDFSITVIGLPEVPVCPPDLTDVCVNAAAFEYGGYTIDPAVLGVGTFDYTITNSNQCGTESCTFSVTVIGLPEAPVCPADLTDVCVNAVAFEYGGYSIDPATLGVGTHPFNITNTNPCGSESCTFYVTVIGLPEAPVCPPDLTDVCVNAVAFVYGGYTIDPAALGVGTHDFTITNSNQCGSYSCTFHVTVIGLPVTPVCPPDIEVLVNAEPFEYGGYTIDPATLGVGTFEYTITNSNPCGSASCSFMVTVNPLTGPAPVLTAAIGGDLSVALTWTAIPDYPKLVHFPDVIGDPAENTWSIYVNSALLNGLTLVPGDEIAIFDGDKIVGSKILTTTPSPETMFETELVAFKTLYDGAGYVPGNPVIFKVWQAAINQESEVCDVVFYDPYSEAWIQPVFPAECCLYSIIDVNCTFAPAYTPTFNVYEETLGLVASGVEGNGYTVEGLDCGTEYCFYVTQILMDATESDASNTLCATTVVCNDNVDWANLQWPAEGTVCVGDGLTTYAQVYIDNGILGENGYEGLDVWIAVGTEDTDPATWDMWYPATFAGISGFTGNPEYSAQIGADLGVGTFYYASKFLYNDVHYYGGFNGGFWDGVNNVSGVLTVETCEPTCVPVWANVQWPPYGTINVGDDYNVYAQVYIPGVSGQGAVPGLAVYIGYSTENVNPAEFTNWVPAVFNVNAGNNSEYMANIGATITEPGTYYYASKFQCEESIVYGGLGGFWDNNSGELTVIISVCEVTCPPSFDVCINDAPWAIWGASPEGGVFSGVGVVDGTMYDPELAGVGAHTITYSYTCENGVTGSCEFVITVNPLPEVICPADLALCIDNGVFYLDGLAEFPASTSAQSVFTGDGVTAANPDLGWYDFEPEVAGVGDHTITYTYTDLNGCANSCTFVITVNALPVVTCPADIEVCINAAPFTLTGGLPAGGDYAVNTTIITQFDPAFWGVGVHQAYYGYTDANGCNDICEFTITVNPLPVVTCPADFAVCVDLAPFTLSGAFPEGGVYSGFGVTLGEFNPASGVGDHTIAYSYTDGNGCSNLCTFTITVNPLPEVTCPADRGVCIDNGILYLEGLPGLDPPSVNEQSVFSGDGVSPSNPAEGWWDFDPAVAGVGPHTITYTYTDGNGCVNFCEFVITVNPLPVVTCPDDFSVCISDAPITLTGGLPAGGDYAVNTTIITVFDPAFWGVGVHQAYYGYTDANGCNDICEFTITVNPLPVPPVCPPDITVCLYDQPFEYGGIMIDPDALGVGTHPFTISVTNDCGSVSCTFYVTVSVKSQTISLPLGWSGFSYNLTPGDCTIPTVFATPLANLSLERIVTLSGAFIPGYVTGGPINSIGCITNAPLDPLMPGGAKVKMLAADQVNVTGCPLTSRVVKLNKGTTFMPVYSFTEVSTVGLFPPQVTAVLEIGGNKVWYKTGVKTLLWLLPGKAYTVLTSGACQFEYPMSDNTNYNVTEPKPVNLTSWNNVNYSQSQHFVSIEGSALTSLQIGDVIGVFNTAGINVGMVEVTDYSVSGVSVFMDDISTSEVDGMTEGELMTYKVYRQSTGEEFVAEATYDVSLPNTNLFSEYGVSSVVNFTIYATGINEAVANEISVYPNPATTLINVTSGIEIRNVKLVNFVGQVVLDQNVDANSTSIDVSNLVTGIYFVKIETTSGAIVTKRVTVN